MIYQTEEASDGKTREILPAELSVIFSSLSKACMKQYLTEEESIFRKLSVYYKSRAQVTLGNAEDVLTALDEDNNSLIPQAEKAANDSNDRGALRALSWNSKVSVIVKSLLKKYLEKGPSFLEGKKIYICEICGFVYLGDKVPQVCPVCKAPGFKMREII